MECETKGCNKEAIRFFYHKNLCLGCFKKKIKELYPNSYKQKLMRMRTPEGANQGQPKVKEHIFNPFRLRAGQGDKRACASCVGISLPCLNNQVKIKGIHREIGDIKPQNATTPHLT